MTKAICALTVLVLIAGILVSIAFAVPALAAEEPPEEELSVPQYLEPDEFFSRFGAEAQQVSAYAMSTNAPITASQCNGLKKILMQMFGDYVPIVTQFQYKNNNNSYYTYVHDITPDYIWWASAAVFFLCLWCVFKMGGAILCKR